MSIRKNLSGLSIQDWIFSVFSLFWVVAIILDYLNKQVLYIPSITHFKYGLLFGILLFVGGLLSASYNHIGFLKKAPPLKVNGLLILLLFAISTISIILAYNVHWKAPLGVSNYWHVIVKILTSIGGVYVLTMAAFSIGRMLRSIIYPSEEQTSLTFHLLDIALGFLVYSLTLLLLGALGLLDQIVVLGLLLLFILVNYKASLGFAIKTLWTPISRPSDLNFWGGLLAFMILVYISMNYLYTQAPFPLGFDARNYYVNISKLIAETGAIVEGFQPYAWSLIMSTGFIAFNSPEITMLISVLGGILSLFAIYDLAKNHFQLSSNYSLLIILLYLVTPTVTNHFIIEFKIDLSLVFVQLVTLTFFLSWLKRKNETDSGVIIEISDRNALIVIGLLLGFCLSIKALSLFLIVALFISIWWLHRDIYGVLGMTASAIGCILLIKLDELSGLRSYHLSPNITGLISLALGLALLAVSFIRSKVGFTRIAGAISVISAVALITFSPWVYKNYSYTKSTSIMKLIIGEKPHPEITRHDIRTNYLNSKKENTER